MSKKFGQLNVNILCTNCGFTHGTPEGEGLNRCNDCGRYASDDPDVCCTRHELRNSPYPSGQCPYCEQERQRKAQIRHDATRDPRVEPW